MGEFSLEEALFFDPLSSEGKELVYTGDVVNLIVSIQRQKDDMAKAGFEAKFVLMNKRNYERLLAYAYSHLLSKDVPNGLIDKIFELEVVVWDVPIDYVNVRAKASVEFAYKEDTLRGKH